MASAPSQEVLKVPATIRTLKERLESAVKREPKLKQAYYRLHGTLHGARLALYGVRGGASGDASGGVAPDKIVWIFRTPRSGSTWLRGILEDLLPCKVWEEPKVAHLFPPRMGTLLVMRCLSWRRT